MPPQRTKSGLLQKLGPVLRNAHEEHRNDETEYSGFGELPPRLSGIAKLVECKFDTIKEGKTNAGEYYFFARGIVVSPKEFLDKRGVTHHVEGLGTSIMEILVDTPTRSRKTVADHYAWILNQLRLLGVSTAEMEADDIETTLAALKESQPYFRFRTWIGEATEEYPDPRTNHVWEGAVEYDEEASGDDQVQDDTGDEPTPPTRAPAPKATAVASKNGTLAKGPAVETSKTHKGPPGPAEPRATAPRPAVAASPPPAKAAATKGPVKKVAPPPEPEPFNEFDDAQDADSLLALANADDEDAQQKLADLAIAMGADEAEVSAAPSWDDVYALWSDAKAREDAAGETPEEETPEERVVAVEDVYLFTPPGQRKAIEVEVTAVDDQKQTTNLKSLDDPKKQFKGVAWDKLVQAT